MALEERGDPKYNIDIPADLNAFVDFEHAGAAEERERLRENIRNIRTGDKECQYDQFHDYYDTGCAQYMARSPYFENGALAVIVLNSIWLGIDADYNDASVLYNAKLPFIIMENLFCTVFTFELVVRFFAYRKKVLALRDMWFMFDSALVLIMIVETWALMIYSAAMGKGEGLGANTSILRLVRMARLMRVARMVRILRLFPEFLIFLRGMVAAFRSMSYSLVMLVIVMYMFAIIFTNLMKETVAGEIYFPNVARSMNSLMCYGTFYKNLRVVLNNLLAEGFQYYLIFLLYTCIASLVVINLLIGCLCEVASESSQKERDAIMVDAVRDLVVDLSGSNLSDKGAQMISKEAFFSMMDSGALIYAFGRISVDVKVLLELSDDLFKDGSVSIDAFMDYIRQVGDSNANVLKEIVDIKRLLLASGQEDLNGIVTPPITPPMIPLHPCLPQFDMPPALNLGVQDVLAPPPPEPLAKPMSPLVKAVADIQKQVTRSIVTVTLNMKYLEDRVKSLEKFVVCERALENHLLE